MNEAPSAPAAFAEYLGLCRQRRRELGLFSCGVLAAFAVFIWCCYRTIQHNFATERLRANAEDLARDLAREATPALLAAAKESVPVFRAQAERELAETLPLLKARTVEELERVREEIPSKAREALRQTIDAPIQNAMRELELHFPALQDAAFRDELLSQVEVEMRTELEALVADTAALYRPHIDRVSRAFEGLAREEDRAKSTDELKRQFVHHWLMLVDHRLMSNGAGAAGTPAIEVGATERGPTTTEQGG